MSNETMYKEHFESAEIERVRLLKVQAGLVEALREQRRQMDYPDLPKAFASTMKRMIDQAIERVHV